MGLGGEETSADTLWDIGGREAIAEHLREVADAKLDAREAEVGEADWAQVERIVLVRTIDSLWVEHLTELDDMRRGIGLRGYAQQDPLNEFRREAFRMYEEFRDLIRHGVASSIFRVTVQRQPPGGGDAALAQNLTRGVAAMRGSGNGAGAGGAAMARRPLSRWQRRPRARRCCAARCRAAPAARNMTASLGGEPVTDGSGGTPGASVAGAGRRRSGRTQARLHADRRADRPQRPVLVRFRRQVQEVPRPLSAGGSSRGLVRVVLIGVVASTAVAGYAAYRIWDQAGRDERRAADAIVVMGAAQYDGRPSPLFAARLDHAIALYHDGVAPRIIVTGGKREGDRTTEAASAREYAIRHDVPEDAILAGGHEPDDPPVDPAAWRRSWTTTDLHSAVFVSDPTHMLRVLRMAADVGIDAYGSPTRTSPLEARCRGAGRRDACTSWGPSRCTSSPASRPRPSAVRSGTNVGWTSRGAGRRKVPSWRWGIGLVYCAKTCRPEAARAPQAGRPRQVAPSPHRSCPACADRESP